jgi:hypothetical protein
MTDPRFSRDGEPRSEPEIIPPGRTDIREAESELRRRVSEGERVFQRIYIAKAGPLGFLPFFLVAGVVAAIFLIFVLGAFLVLLPLAGFALAAAVFTGLLRGRPR